jgi:transcriptional regulator with XRE-family HTH domain
LTAFGGAKSRIFYIISPLVRLSFFWWILLFQAANYTTNSQIIFLLGGASLDGILDPVRLGNRIKTARIARGLTQAVLAAKIDLSTKYISNIECGAKVPRLDTLVMIANALDTDANTLLVDSLQVAPAIASTQLSKELDKLPQEEQQRLLRLFEIMVDDAQKR